MSRGRREASAMDPIGELRSVILPVRDMDAAIAFWSGAVGLPVKFRDGDRYAALDAGALTIALAAGTEATPGVAVSFKVADAAVATHQLSGAGASVHAAPSEGP